MYVTSLDCVVLASLLINTGLFTKKLLDLASVDFNLSKY
jgi:hypothetical protein